ncbi:MAG: recombination regulator RecX [Selenomonas sp.]|jgi:regulatory protein|nr:recombination regulator RecX [Selenomonas sp.]
MEDDGQPRPPKRPRKTALITAVDILARQEQSEKKLREKLGRKGYSPEEIQTAIDRLIEKHYLNDADACARQFEFLYQESRSSIRQISIKLMQRGFDSALIKDCIPVDTFEREKAAALRVLAMKFKPSADRQKMMANLYSKGFDSSAIRAAVEEFMAEEEQE